MIQTVRGKEYENIMTPEENKRRAADENVNYIKAHICDAKKGKPFVFISYKSDDWETVLRDVVYRLVKDHGLNVYFDGSFDTHNSLWIDQFPENMENANCKGVLAFLDDKYATSYATLMELGYSQSHMDSTDHVRTLPVVPINLGKLTEITDEGDTGLGKSTFENGEKNINAKAEKEFLDDVVDKLKKVFLHTHRPYKTRPSLSKRLCSAMMEELIASLHVNDNYYERGDKLDGIVQSIKDACGSEVFQNVILPDSVSVSNKDVSPVPDEIEITVDKLPEELTISQPQLSDIITGPAPLVSHKVHSASENQPEAIPDLVPGCMRKWTYHTRKGANAVLLWDGTSKNCKVLKGSIAAKEAPNFAASASAAKKLKDQLVSQGNFSGLTFIADYDCDKIATMINLLNGGSVSMPAEIKGKNLRLAEDDVEPAEMVPLEAVTDKQELQSPEPVPSAEPAGSPSDECIYTYKNARIQCDINSNRCTVLKGSRTQGESPKFVTNAAGAKKLKDELNQKRIIENDVFLEDYTGSMATLLNLINGGSVSSTREKEKFVREN